MPDWTNPQPVNTRSNTILSGFLRRSGRTGKTLGLRQKRFYKLDGAIFSKHLTETSNAIWDINVQGAQIGRLGRTNFGIRLNNLEKRAAKDFHNNLIVLYARSEEECNVWVAALRNASQRKLEDYYEVMELIGEGGFAKVRLGRCLASNEKRAIKTMNKAEAHAKVLGTEVAIIKRVDHPNIVKTFDVFETSEQIHIVMEYMEGGMLYDAIEDGVQFEEADVVQFMRELLDGVHYLHEIGIVHRDIKPENVLCTSTKAPLHVKIADFGLSSISTVADMKENRMLMSTMIGTPEFVAPEIARQETYTEKVDMWALGMLCYNVIAHRLPLDESRDMIAQLQEGITLTFPEQEWYKFSPDARSFVKSLLCPESGKRLSPIGCLVHRWIERISPEKSTKFAAHGRMSNILFAPTEKQKIVMQRYRTLDVKKTWLKLYLAVNALCKLTRSCGALKMFGSARLRAVSIQMDRRTAINAIEGTESGDSATRLPVNNHLVCTATSNSTAGGDDDIGKNSNDGLLSTPTVASSSKNIHANNGRVGHNISSADGGGENLKGIHIEARSPSQFHAATSVDLDLGFDEDTPSDLDAPNSFNWNDRDGPSTAIEQPTSLRGVLRFAPFHKKGRGAGLGSDGQDGPKTDMTEIKAVRKLNQKLGKKSTSRNLANVDNFHASSNPGTSNGGHSTPHETNHEPHYMHQQHHIYDGEVTDATEEQGGSLSAMFSTPWRSSGSVATPLGGGGSSGHVLGKNSSSKPSLRKRIISTFTGDSRTGSGAQSRKVNQKPMSKLRSLMRKVDSARSLNSVSSNHSHNGSGVGTGSKFASESAVGNGNLTNAPTIRENRNLTIIGMGDGFDIEDKQGRTREFHEGDDRDLPAEARVRTFDASQFKQMYSDHKNNHRTILPKFNKHDTILHRGPSIHRSGSGPAMNAMPSSSGANEWRGAVARRVVDETICASPLANEGTAINRMSPLTPSTEAAKRQVFRK